MSSNTFAPRTYGSTLWWVFCGLFIHANAWGKPGHDLQIRKGFIDAADAALNTLGSPEAVADLVRDEPDKATDAITAAWPEGHSFPSWSVEALQQATRTLASPPFTLDRNLDPALYGYPDLAAFDTTARRMWAWARNRTVPMPPLGNDPVDTLSTYFGSYLGEPLPATGSVKAFVALIGEEKARFEDGWAKYAVGSRWRVTSDRPYGAGVVTGDVVEIVDPEQHRHIRAKVVMGDGSLGMATWSFALSTTDLEPVVEEEAVVGATIDESQAKIAELESRIGALNDLVQTKDRTIESYRDWQRAAHADAEKIGDILNKEAERRNWCREYDDIVEKINGELRYLALPRREREVEVTVTGWLRVPFSRTVTVTVTSGDNDDAIEQAEEIVSEEDASELWSYADRGAAEVDNDDFESEVC